METAVTPYHSLSEELKKVEEYLSSESKIHDGKLHWECTVDPGADTTTTIPQMLVKGFVEHAIRYNNFKEPHGGKIEVSVHRTNLGILIMVTDNGEIRYNEYNQEKYAGNRLELLNQHIEIFNKEQNHSINYQVLDVAYCEPGKSGTRVLITIAL